MRGERVLIVGNGPSRVGREELIYSWDGPVIGCNGLWRFVGRRFDALVCFDAAQSAAALTAGRPIADAMIVPQQIATR